MVDESKFAAFSKEIRSVTSKLLDLLEKHPTPEGEPIPPDWPATRVLLRNVAESLMLCTSVENVAEKIRENMATMWILVSLVNEIDHEFYLSTLRRAFDSRPQQSDFLPGQAYATYLLALADGPNPVWRQDFGEFYSQ